MQSSTQLSHVKTLIWVARVSEFKFDLAEEPIVTRLGQATDQHNRWYGIHNFHEYDFPMINKYDIGVNDMEENDLNDAHSELSLEII